MRDDETPTPALSTDPPADAPTVPPRRLVLASASPRRRELLASLDLEFEVRPADVPEVRGPGEAPGEYVLRLAREKAAARPANEELVLAADTIVVLPGSDGDTAGSTAEVLEKPADAADARRMLKAISGRWHTVLTGVAALAPGPQRSQPLTASAVVSTRVRLAAMEDGLIRWYVATGEPMDKAGSYAIQGLGAMFVEEVEGNYSNVVGLPLPAVFRLVGQLGVDLRDFRRQEG